jgi:hypothetical protein
MQPQSFLHANLSLPCTASLAVIFLHSTALRAFTHASTTLSKPLLGLSKTLLALSSLLLHSGSLYQHSHGLYTHFHSLYNNFIASIVSLGPLNALSRPLPALPRPERSSYERFIPCLTCFHNLTASIVILTTSIELRVSIGLYLHVHYKA